MFDTIIIGGGPAGLTAAIYLRRAGKSAIVLEKATFGGQITYSPEVENIPGFTKLSGNEFAEKIVDQALFQGVEFCSDTAKSVTKENNIFKVETDLSGTLEARTLIVATGAKHRSLGLPDEEKLIGNGISFCAVCDGAFFSGEDVAVIGGGNSALQEAVLLSGTSRRVTIFQDLPELTGEKALQEKLIAKDNVNIICNTKVIGYIGENLEEGIPAVKGIRVLHTDTGKEEEFPVTGIFIAIGLVPQNEIVSSLAELDSRGYLVADESCKTKTPGLFAAGDGRTKKIR